MGCWSWGLSVGQYYKLLAGVLFVLALPIFFLREVSSKHIPTHTFGEHFLQLWETLKNPTTLFLLIFVSGNGAFSQLTPVSQPINESISESVNEDEGSIHVCGCVYCWIHGFMDGDLLERRDLCEMRAHQSSSFYFYIKNDQTNELTSSTTRNEPTP